MTPEPVADALDNNADRIIAALLTPLIYSRAQAIERANADNPVSWSDAVETATQDTLLLYDDVVTRVAELAESSAPSQPNNNQVRDDD